MEISADKQNFPTLNTDQSSCQHDSASESRCANCGKVAVEAPLRSLAETVWPKERDIGRYGDMSTTAHIRVGLDTDSDVYVSVWDENGGASVEFC